MRQATVINLEQFRRRREARRRAATVVPAAPWAPVMIMVWYPVQWVWLCPTAKAVSVTA